MVTALRNINHGVSFLTFMSHGCYMWPSIVIAESNPSSVNECRLAVQMQRLICPIVNNALYNQRRHLVLKVHDNWPFSVPLNTKHSSFRVVQASGLMVWIFLVYDTLFFEYIIVQYPLSISNKQVIQ